MINDITGVVIVKNEELHIERCIRSLRRVSRDIVVVDSFSTDRTVEICHELGVRVFQRAFDNFSNQRNYSLKETNITSEYVLVLDADEYLSDELVDFIETCKLTMDGYFLNRRFIWKGTWLKRAYYPLWILRLAKSDLISCDNRGINEHLQLPKDSTIGKAKGDFIDENMMTIAGWMSKHNDYSSREAPLLNEHLNVSLFGAQNERKKWLRYNVWNRLPGIFRPAVLFIYRFLIQFVWLDGKKAVIYHIMDIFIYRVLTEVKLLEGKWNDKP